MDPSQNPFSPGAGTPPPELVGRNSILEDARILFARVKIKRSEKSMLLIGLRGVGKTVLLNEMAILGQKNGYQTIFLEAAEGLSFASLLIPPLKTLLYDLDRMAGISQKVKRGLAVLRSFISSIKLTIKDVSIGIDIEPASGTADSGNLEIDLPNLFIAIGEAAADRGCAVAILIDEIQYFTQKELGGLIMAVHRIQQLRLPIVLLGAGLPNLPGLAGEAKSYAERLFRFPVVGALSEKETGEALSQPAQAGGVVFDPLALQEIFRLTKGYPYFLQEWGYQTWNLAATNQITLQTVQNATAEVIPRLDENFFQVRFDRLTPAERYFLRAMAKMGFGPHRAGDIADVLKIRANSISPIRASLIKKGMIYSPTYGEMAFTVPLFDEFMMRAMPDV